MRDQVAPFTALAALSLAGLLLAPPALAAGPSIEPGLWEVQSDMQSPDRPELAAQMAKAREQMKNMPPEVRKMMEQQLSKSGVGLTKNGIRMCVSPEQARGDRPPKTEENPHCTHSQAQLSGNTWRGEFVCTQPPGKGSFETVVHDRKHYTTQGTMQTQQGTIKTRNEARWVQADCGTLKPAR